MEAPLISGAIIAGTLLVMAGVAVRAGRMLPAGRLPLRREGLRDYPRWLVLGIWPVIVPVIMTVRALTGGGIGTVIGWSFAGLIILNAHMLDIRRGLHRRTNPSAGEADPNA